MANFSKIQIFEFGDCCSQTFNSPENHSERQRLGRNSKFLKNQGIELFIINVATNPGLLAEIPGIDDYLNDKDVDIFPLTIIENKVVKEKEFPTQEELTTWTGIKISE